MPYYRISYHVSHGQYSKSHRGVRYSDEPLERFYAGYLMRLNHLHGYGRIEHFDCVQLAEQSPDVERYRAEHEGPERA